MTRENTAPEALNYNAVTQHTFIDGLMYAYLWLRNLEEDVYYDFLANHHQFVLWLEDKAEQCLNEYVSQKGYVEITVEDMMEFYEDVEFEVPPVHVVLFDLANILCSNRFSTIPPVKAA